MPLPEIGLFVGSYLLGAIPTSYLVCRLARGIDLRQTGSKNLGATNLYRVMGWGYAIPVALFDMFKGWFPVAVLGPAVSAHEWVPLAAGVTAVLGHMFSPFVRFRGGKGVATGAGVLLALAPLAILASLVIWAVTLKVTGYVSLGSILAAALFPLMAELLHPERPSILWIEVGLALLIIWMHRANIRRLVSGTENRFGTRPRSSRP